MATRVNAALAAFLVGASEKAMRAWFKSGRIAGAKKVSRLGHPEEWQIDMERLHAEAAAQDLIDQDRIRIMRQWIDLSYGLGSGGSASGGGGSQPPPNGGAGPVNGGNGDGPPLSSGRSPEGGLRMAGTFRNPTEAARWLMTHGVHSESTPKSWPGWPPSRLDPANVLALAIERQDIGNWRITWRLHECDNPTCVCHTML